MLLVLRKSKSPVFPSPRSGYKLAYDFLAETYGDKRVVIPRLYDKLKSINKPTKNHISIKVTYEALEPRSATMFWMNKRKRKKVLAF